MSYNHGLERKKFEARQRQLRRQYEQVGMAEADIQAMYRFDLAVFNCDRRHGEHAPEMPVNLDSLIAPNDGKHPRLWWVEEIDDPILTERLKALCEMDLELLTLFAFDGYGQAEIAVKLGVSQAAISKKLTRLKNFLNFSGFGL